ncbi:PREDICTED: synergistic-like venom protein [Branchiostoma belcheri]|uniref:Synergistic-like venom protein n=1 Tax=Branchiostoma belcheri TaxID=7741 RepID=A0A6P4XUU5_BRABE|nr:PREDICTED: synergistic-like venom protein [Branchiostoma belcheri]
MKILLLAAAVAWLVCKGEALSCYSCDAVDTDAICNRSGEVKCGAGTDTCYAIKGGLQGGQFVAVRKGCTSLDKCRKVKDEQPCDVTQLHWACVECCQTDSCNRVAPSPP